MEVDVSYTENLDASKIALLLESSRLEYIPTVAQASSPDGVGGVPPPTPYALYVHPLLGGAAKRFCGGTIIGPAQSRSGHESCGRS
jgi:hypothetical protein